VLYQKRQTLLLKLYQLPDPNREIFMPAPQAHHVQRQQSQHRGRWVVILLLVVICVMAFYSWRVVRALGAFMWGFQPPEMMAAQYSAKDVIGDLGGMPVKISRHVAENVEYDGDPGFSGPPRQGPPPERTYASRLKSFGFDIRFPDMAMLTSREMWANKKSYTIFNTQWMRVSITSGESFPGRGFMNRPHVSNGQTKDDYWWNTYEEIPVKKFGLTEYRLVGIDPRTGQPARDHREAKIIYIHRDRDGKVLTRIDCDNVPHEAVRCTQSWSMEAKNVDAEIGVHYRRGFLRDWPEIQQRVTQVILDFRIEPNNKEMAKTPYTLSALDPMSL
jgi:hypothetical protein